MRRCCPKSKSFGLWCSVVTQADGLEKIGKQAPAVMVAWTWRSPWQNRPSPYYSRIHMTRIKGIGIMEPCRDPRRARTALLLTWDEAATTACTAPGKTDTTLRTGGLHADRVWVVDPVLVWQLRTRVASVQLRSESVMGRQWVEQLDIDCRNRGCCSNRTRTGCSKTWGIGPCCHALGFWIGNYVIVALYGYNLLNLTVRLRHDYIHRIWHLCAIQAIPRHHQCYNALP